MAMTPAMDRLVRLTTEQVAPMPRYSAARGGHAPGHLRAWFDEYVETGGPSEEMRGKALTLDWLFGQLWNCVDALPRVVCTGLDLPPGSTYAQAAREERRKARRRCHRQW